MTIGQKLSALRKEKNYTQEQLADILGVSRQAISKWESDLAYPETEKLIRLSALYDCSMDYLLKEDVLERKPVGEENQNQTLGKAVSDFLQGGFHYTSQKKIGSLPLVDVNLSLKEEAKGVIAFGFRAKGILSIGFLSMGVISFGCLSMGILSFGALALGILSVGAISIGILFALGAIAIGLFAFGAIALGMSSIGALSVGYYSAYGDYAYAAKLAIYATYGKGATKVTCKADLETLREIVDRTVPAFFAWFAKLPL